MFKGKNWLFVALILLLAVFLAFFVIPGKIAKKIGVEPLGNRPYHLGLDLQGGIRLLYQTDLSQIAKEDWKDSVEGLRDVIERRVNLFGVQEPIVQIQKTGEDYRLIVELAGIDDPAKAIDMIGQTPYLDFREEMTVEEKKEIIEIIPEETIKMIIEDIKKNTGEEITKEELPQYENLRFYLSLYKPTELTGKYLKRAQVQFDQTTNKPEIGLEFNAEGAKLFEEITGRNIGKPLAIFIDDELISAPIVQDKISGGRAQITGSFTIDEARKLARNLNAGALPLKIELISEQNIGPSLGRDSVNKSLLAGIIGFSVVVLFMVLIYRLSGVLASVALLFYGVLLLSLFKMIPVTLTLAGIAGFILSLGMAVDANILVFERLREEIILGRSLDSAMSNSFLRAWPSIRDGNLTTLGICLILFLFASGFVQGFALTLSVGILVSMFTAMVITRLFMKAFGGTRLKKIEWIWTR